MKKFSIIIINYNTFSYTKNCINSIFKNLNLDDFEIILVDNNSLDKSGLRLKEFFGDKLKYVFNVKNLGFGKANNEGAKIAEGEYLWFLNSDTLINKVDLKEINNFFQNHNDIGIISLDLLLDNYKRQEYAFGDFLLLSNFFRKESNQGKDNGNYIEVDWVSGASMIVRKDVFLQLRGFDKRYFMYFEDMDLCRMFQKEGYQACVLPAFSVIHFGGKSSLDYKNMKKDYYISQDKYFAKFYGKIVSFFMKFIRFFYLKLIKK